MKIKKLHEWDIDYASARLLQEKLAGRVSFDEYRGPVRNVCGIDCAFSKDKKWIYAAAVVLSFAELETVEVSRAKLKVTYPYIPGLLSFREAPVCLKAVEQLKSNVDVFFVDGQGIAHPRRLGLAAHLGLFLDKPTIGCAKSRLCGDFETPGLKKGSASPLTDKGRLIGHVLRTRDSIKPLFVSTGHKCSQDQAVSLCLDCTTRYRLPEPTRRAHIEVSKMKKSDP